MHTHVSLINKRILLGVSGSIAAYKAAELLRLLQQAGAEVRVVLTAGGAEFVTPLTFQALSGHPVHRDLLDEEAEAGMGHIGLARWADAVVVAPASANFLARLAQGRADDLLSAICLASQAKLAVAPAMNQQMWANPATQDNLSRLNQRQVAIFGPASGEQACGEQGPGRMLEAMELVSSVASLFESGRLAGKTVLVTAGPTQEALDPVRYLTNRSSGKMGYAIAQAAADAGARTILVSGPTRLSIPPRVHRVEVLSALEMHQAVMQAVAESDIFIAAAAVADYRPVEVAPQKIKKQTEHLSIQLQRNPDILAEVAAAENGPFCVGFAAETENLEEHSRNKLRDKRLDLIAANLVGDKLGFDQDDNTLTVFSATDSFPLGKASKQQLATRLIDIIADQLAQTQN